MRRLNRFLDLSPTERQKLAVAALVLGLVKLGLIILPFQSLQNILAKMARRQDRPEPDSAETRDQVVWAIEAASRNIPLRLNCLPQALAAYVLLTRQGYKVSVRYGVAKDDEGRLEAHAWVECQGQTVIGGADRERFTPLVSLEGKTA